MQPQATIANSSSKLRIATINHTHFIDPDDIIRIESMSNYSKLFFINGKSLLASKVLNHFDELLTGNKFSRIHRTHLVNLRFVTQFRSGDQSSVSLVNEDVLPVSRSRKKMLQQKMMMISL